MADGRLVRAAGAVVVRGTGPQLEVLLVHRPRYDDWSHPKGKCDRGEEYRATCLREVLEETGLDVELAQRLQTVHYVDGLGRPKKVKYWLARPADGRGDIDREPDAEVDEAAWLPVDKARKRISAKADRRLLDEARELLAWLEHLA